MRRVLTIFALGALMAPAAAHAQTGGSTPAAPAAAAPGGTTPTGGTVPDVTQGVTGGNTASRPFRIPPVIRGFSASPRSLVWGSGPTRLRFRVDATNLSAVRVALDVRATGSRSRRRVSLGRVRTGRVVTRRWTRAGIAPGTYRLALRVVDGRGRSLARAATATITVKVRPRPRPRPAPAADPAPAPAPSGSGVFPIQGAHTWGEGFGVDRGTHRHNGQDLAAASGTPLVSPRRGTVHAAGHGGGSGYYVVVKDAERDHYYVYFHLLAGSTVVSEGQPVSAGQRIGSVGSTGHSTGPHRHFELWVGAWWGGGHAVDPAPFLRSL
ncbi:MAG TPA: M23 family metallopeptidase [Solirubrobacteraceae bacterium]|nr:M23 family metallopeptidase [Solirubrobacteraceae bacterium]